MLAAPKRRVLGIPRRPRLILALVSLAVVAIYSCNAVVLLWGTPQPAEARALQGASALKLETWEAENVGIEVFVADSVSLTSIADVPVTGTVSGLGRDEIFIVHSDDHGAWPLEYVLDHELHHIQQLDLVDSISISSPSWWNPIATASHYGALALLTMDLDRVFVSVSGEGSATERAADCYAVWIRGSYAGSGDGAYGDVLDCSVDEVAAALAVSQGVWPSSDAIADRRAAAAHLRGDARTLMKGPSNRSEVVTLDASGLH